ncbi:hypothetical protein ACOSP7_028619 [Xanthoceras sorbifolium]
MGIFVVIDWTSTSLLDTCTSCGIISQYDLFLVPLYQSRCSRGGHGSEPVVPVSLGGGTRTERDRNRRLHTGSRFQLRFHTVTVPVLKFLAVLEPENTWNQNRFWFPVRNHTIRFEMNLGHLLILFHHLIIGI